MKAKKRNLLQKREREKHRFLAPRAGLDGFASVYRAAAAQLAGERVDGGTWALPVVFLYRHAIEVLIKAILTEFGPDAGVCPKCALRRSHNLKNQLPDLRTVASRSGTDLTGHLEEFIQVLHKEDPHGMKARYPLTMDGEPQDLTHGDAFDLRAFASDSENALNELADLLNDLEAERHPQDILRAQGISN